MQTSKVVMLDCGHTDMRKSINGLANTGTKQTKQISVWRSKIHILQPKKEQTGERTVQMVECRRREQSNETEFR